jgi:hypothetical protein
VVRLAAATTACRGRVLVIGRPVDVEVLGGAGIGHEDVDAHGAAYYAAHARALRHWDDRVIVNVDEPIGDPWCRLLEQYGYRIAEVIPAYTRRYGGLNNADKRADHEVVIVAARGAPTRLEQLTLFDPEQKGDHHAH